MLKIEIVTKVGLTGPSMRLTGPAEKGSTVSVNDLS